MFNEGVKLPEDRRLLVEDEKDDRPRVVSAQYPTKTKPHGVWVAYHYDQSNCAIFEHEVDAYRVALAEGYSKVKFWPFGTDLVTVMRSDV